MDRLKFNADSLSKSRRSDNQSSFGLFCNRLRKQKSTFFLSQFEHEKEWSLRFYKGRKFSFSYKTQFFDDVFINASVNEIRRFEHPDLAPVVNIVIDNTFKQKTKRKRLFRYVVV